MDSNTTHSNADEHQCSRCYGHGDMMCGHGHHHWKYVIIKILVALFIFWAGVQFGELKAVINSQFGGYGMMGWTQGNQGYFRSPMMFYNSVHAAGIPSTATTTR